MMFSAVIKHLKNGELIIIIFFIYGILFANISFMTFPVAYAYFSPIFVRCGSNVNSIFSYSETLPISALSPCLIINIIILKYQKNKNIF